MEASRPILIDCDTGRDDALAIWLSKEFGWQPAAILASYGNVGLDKVVDNCARVLHAAGWDNIPLLAGAAGPLKEHALYNEIVIPRQRASGNGLCDIDLPESPVALSGSVTPAILAERVRDLAKQHGKLHYFILGPATNFASIATELGDHLNSVIEKVTMMGGTFSPLWENSGKPDFNIACDPYAVDKLLSQHIEIRFLPLNATWPVKLSIQDIDNLEPRTLRAEIAKDLMLAYCRKYSPDGCFRFHDPSLLLAAREDSLFRRTKLIIECDDQLPDFGRLYESESGFEALVFECDDHYRKILLEQMLDALGFKINSRFAQTCI